MKIAAILVLVALTTLLTATSLWLAIENRTNKRALAIIATAQAGQPISKVIDAYGSPSFQTEDVQSMHSGGAPVFPFCEGKTMYQYYISPPCIWVNIYTDKDGIIAFVNWSNS